MAINILTMKWGTRYSATYVNRLYLAVSRYLDFPFRFLCFTDDAESLHPEIKCYPLPDTEFPQWAYDDGAWPKVGMLKRGLAGLEGQCLFLDLDIVLRRSLGELFEYHPGRNCFIKDWEQPHQRLRHLGQPRIVNSSVFRFEADSLGGIYDEFVKTRQAALSSFRNEQRFVSSLLDQHIWWPSSWIVSFKRQCIPVFPGNLLYEPKEPQEARIVVFHGRPNPHEAAAGYRKGPVHRWVRPTGWVAAHWAAS